MHQHCGCGNFFNVTMGGVSGSTVQIGSERSTSNLGPDYKGISSLLKDVEMKIDEEIKSTKVSKDQTEELTNLLDELKKEVIQKKYPHKIRGLLMSLSDILIHVGFGEIGKLVFSKISTLIP